MLNRTAVTFYDNNIFLEIDVKLENGDKVMLVEVKTKPTTMDVQDHIRRLKKCENMPTCMAIAD